MWPFSFFLARGRRVYVYGKFFARRISRPLAWFFWICCLYYWSAGNIWMAAFAAFGGCVIHPALGDRLVQWLKEREHSDGEGTEGEELG